MKPHSPRGFPYQRKSHVSAPLWARTCSQFSPFPIGNWGGFQTAAGELFRRGTCWKMSFGTGCQPPLYESRIAFVSAGHTRSALTGVRVESYPSQITRRSCCSFRYSPDCARSVCTDCMVRCVGSDQVQSAAPVNVRSHSPIRILSLSSVQGETA